MSTLSNPHPLGSAIATALGLDVDSIYAVRLDSSVGDVERVEVTYIVTSSPALPNVEYVTKRYELVEISDEAMT